ncbi:MAG: BACON domain-containing protein, partial [Syntrophothermus sp.]
SVWRDGYYMGDNNSSANDIYVFQREVMLTGGPSPKSVGFNNAWRPSSVDGFMCVPPIDNDGPFAPTGTPGLYIAFNDDAFGGGTDQLWIYELAVDWTTTTNSTFNRVQQLEVPAFDANFGNNWNNITQKGTSQKVDGIPQVIMNVPQYRNFGTYQTIVCCHTVDVDATNHAGIRWYELRRSGTNPWTLRQSGTYAPDALNRWMGCIMLNNFSNLALAYSVSSTDEYPGIRFCGQSAAAYSSASGVMDIMEDTIHVGTNSQTSANRWGDYAQVSVDPSDDKTFWFTTEYIGSGGSRKTKIASFVFQSRPIATTEAATYVTGSTATINGIVNPQGLETTYYFKYGPNGFSLNDSTPAQIVGSGTDTVHVSFPLSGLLINKKYYYQIFAYSLAGTVSGAKLNFTTLNEPAFLTVTPPVQNVALASGSTGYQVSSNTTWTVGNSASWSTLDTTAGAGVDSIHATFEENTTPYSRIDTLTFISSAGSQPALLVQAGIPAILLITPPVQNVNVNSGTTDFAVTSNVTWTASSDAPWCTVTPSGNGDGTITATFGENTVVGTRTATITVVGTGAGAQTVTVVQDGIAAILSVTPLTQNVPAEAGSTTFNVTSNTTWTVASDAPWCTATAGGTGNGTINADYLLNTTTDPRVANLQVIAAGVAAVQLTVNQARPANGIDEHATPDFNIYPNPSTGSVTFIPGLNDYNEIEITIHDVNGKKVYTQTYNDRNIHNLDLSALASGAYQVTVKSKERVTTTKLVIL